jgi:uncharacterized protein YdaL
MNATRGTRKRCCGMAVAVAMSAALALTGTAKSHPGGAPREPQQPAAGLSAGALLGTSVSSVKGGKGKSNSGVPVGAAAPGAVGTKTLVLYDSTNTWGWAGELFGIAAGNLVSHFGPWKAEPVVQYQAGQMSSYDATVYVGSTYDEPLPTAFLDDVYASSEPVIWMYDNIWQLTDRYASFQSKYGWMWSGYDFSSVSHVDYNGTLLTRDGAHNAGGIMDYSSVDTTKADVLGWAVRDSDGTRFPWAVRSGNLTYIGENPFTWMGTDTDRVVAFEDILFDALQPNAPTRHRALVRLEDIFPNYDPQELKDAADYLYSQHIPFGFGVSPVYTDPTGYYDSGTPTLMKLSDKGNQVTPMIRYLEDHGGTLIMHGWTHQYQDVPNPFSGVTGDDAEFYRVEWNSTHTGLDYEGGVPEDTSPDWAGGRIASSFREFKKAHLDAPTVFEFPHYLGIAPDYEAVARLFQTRWDRALYYGGLLTGEPIDMSHAIGEAYPFVVRDVYGTTVLPENLGDYAPEPWEIFPAHTVSDILASAKAELAVRDGVAGFFYHPFEGVAPLQQIIDGLRAQGWTFVSPTQVAANG